MAVWTFEAIGTRWNLEFSEPQEDIELLKERITERIEEFDAAYSRFRPDSFVTHIAREPGTYVLPDDAEPLLDVYADLYQKTSGRFTPYIGSTLSEAGYDAAYTLIPGDVKPPPRWDVDATYAYPALTLTEPTLIDVGAAGKGYLVDIVAQLLEEAGVEHYVVEAGGDFRVRDAGGIRVGLEHPEYPDQAVGVVELIEGSVCGSAGNRRAWSTYTHIIDPETLESPRQILATWVVAKTALVADALATCLFFVEAQVLTDYEFEYLILYPDYTIERSVGFPAELFTL